MQDAVTAQGVETKTDPKTRVFISYSRKDMAFADRLEAVLKTRGFEVLIDRQEIYAFEDWWKRLQALIASADTIVFALSPDAVASREALREVEYAASLNKRFAPIVCRRVEDAAVPEQLRRLNFIFFDEADRFEDSGNKLAAALQTDIAWIRRHTEFGDTAHRWVEAGRPGGMLLRPPVLDQAEAWLAFRPGEAPAPTGDTEAFIAQSRKAMLGTQRLRRIALGSIFSLMMAVILGLVGIIKQDFLKAQWHWWTVTWPYARANVWPYVLSTAKEQALKPGDSFKECAQDCPEMIVVPAGSFTMGAPQTESHAELYDTEIPQHMVTIAKPFAVSKYELTFADWDACVAGGGCNGYKPLDEGWSRGQQPVLQVTWEDAQAYAAWLSQVTGKTYRLLTETEYEYAMRAATTTTYPWGDDIKLNGQAMADCDGCGGQWDGKQPAPVGSFAPNKFGLYDMVGNVWEWVEDCFHNNYNGAPTDGSAWVTGADCSYRVLRGGSYDDKPGFLRSAFRFRYTSGTQIPNLGFRVGRTLDVTLTKQQIEQVEQQQAEQQQSWCDNKKKAFSLDLQIVGCTAVIRSGKLNGGALASVYLNRGDAYAAKNDYDRAVADLTQAIALDPKNADALDDRCYVNAVVGQLKAALLDCNKALQLRPNVAATLDSRGFTYLKLGQFAKAIADYNAALKIDPKMPSSLYGQGVAEIRMGNTAAGNADIAAAKLIQADIVQQMAALGIRP